MDKYCTFPAIEKAKLFKLTIFNYLIGNEDMHLKKFSLIAKEKITALSPHYDLINTSIIVNNLPEEIALPIDGRKNKLTGKLLIDYFGKEVL